MLASLGNSYLVLKEFLQEVWQIHHDPSHAIYGMGEVIVLFIIFNRILNKYQLSGGK